MIRIRIKLTTPAMVDGIHTAFTVSPTVSPDASFIYQKVTSVGIRRTSCPIPQIRPNAIKEAPLSTNVYMNSEIAVDPATVPAPVPA